MILIADSGSTKTDWSIVENGVKVKTVFTKGINPFFQDEQEIAKELALSLLPEVKAYKIGSVRFYGAGCIPEKQAVLKQAIVSILKIDDIEVNTDMLAAARSLCGRNAGIVCILGTGSNSCFYDGNEIVSNVSPLGFILGDEGSGAVLGKLLVGDVLKNQISADLREKFMERYKMSMAEIIERVYRKPYPNRFLAGFSPFLSEHIQHSEIRTLVETSFRAFFMRNVRQYDYNEHLVHLVGSVAFHYQDVLQEVAAECGIRLGVILGQPMDGLIVYHSIK